MNRIDAAKAAEELTRILLDADVLNDEVRDIVRSDEEFTYLAIARKYTGCAAKEANLRRTRACELAQYDLDGLAIERLRDLLLDADVSIEAVSGDCPIVKDGVSA